MITTTTTTEATTTLHRNDNVADDGIEGWWMIWEIIVIGPVWIYHPPMDGEMDGAYQRVFLKAYWPGYLYWGLVWV
jgi:hypothetical protein